MIIKVCGMRDQKNILQLLEHPAPDLMGLIFYPPSSRFVGRIDPQPSFYKALEIPKVGVFVDAKPEEIVGLADAYGLDYIQLHGNESPAYILALKEMLSVKYIKVFRVGEEWEWDLAEPFVGLVDIFLFDTQTPMYGGSGKTFGWDTLLDYPFAQPFLLSGGVEDEHHHEILALMEKIPAMKGIDINSKFELEPALKDIDKVKAFINHLRFT